MNKISRQPDPDHTRRVGESLLIVGTGALASLFAARLASVGFDITLLGTWREAIHAFNHSGVYLEAQHDGGQLLPVRAITDPQQAIGARWALVLVKGWQTRRAAAQLASCLAPDGLALTLQNGLGNREILIENLGAQRVAAGVTTLGASLMGPGRVRLAGDGPVILEQSQALNPLIEYLRQAGFRVQLADNLATLQWGKLVVNAAINPLTAILDVNNGELIALPEVRFLLSKLAQEAAAVAAAQGITLPYSDPAAAVEQVAIRTAQNYSSMLQDIRRGAPTEIDQISGMIFRLGQQVGVATPFTHVVWLLVKALQSQADPTKELVFA